MPKRRDPKCIRCSKLSLEEALLLHGPDGDNCWKGSPLYTQLDASGKLDETCHKRRSYYKNRDLYNRNRRLKYRGENESSVQTSGVSVPVVPALMIHFYRETQTSPLHALGSELWLGPHRRESLPVEHTDEWTPMRVKTQILALMKEYSERYDLKVDRICTTKDISPSECPLTPCLLKASPSSGGNS